MALVPPTSKGDQVAGTAVGGDLTGTLPNPTVANVSLLTLKGDVLYASANATAARLPIGATGQVAKVVSGAPAYDYPPGFEFGYDAITAPVTVSSATEASGTTVITCAAHTFDGAAVLAHFYSPALLPGGGDFVLVSLFESATQIGRLCNVAAGQTAGTLISIQSLAAPGSGFHRFTPSAGSHTYTVTAFRNAANGTVTAGAGGTATNLPAFIRFTKV